MSLEQFNKHMLSLQREANFLVSQNEKLKSEMTQRNHYKSQNVKLSHENESLKRELERFKNNIAFSKEQIVELTQQQRSEIQSELDGWSENIYNFEDRILDNSNSCDSGYYERERERISTEQFKRYEFIQKLMTILGG